MKQDQVIKFRKHPRHVRIGTFLFLLPFLPVIALVVWAGELLTEVGRAFRYAHLECRSFWMDVAFWTRESFRR